MWQAKIKICVHFINFPLTFVKKWKIYKTGANRTIDCFFAKNIKEHQQEKTEEEFYFFFHFIKNVKKCLKNRYINNAANTINVKWWTELNISEPEHKCFFKVHKTCATNNVFAVDCISLTYHTMRISISIFSSYFFSRIKTAYYIVNTFTRNHFIFIFYIIVIFVGRDDIPAMHKSHELNRHHTKLFVCKTAHFYINHITRMHCLCTLFVSMQSHTTVIIWNGNRRR